jgi:hypothetical protein
MHLLWTDVTMIHWDFSKLYFLPGINMLLNEQIFPFIYLVICGDICLLSLEYELPVVSVSDLSKL